MENREEQLEKEIADKKEELLKLQEEKSNSNRRNAVKELSEFTDEEKIAEFDKMYIRAKNDLESIEGEDYCEDNDEDNDAWMAQMEVLARNNNLFWKYYRSLQN